MSSRQDGFTLIELVVVIAILGILAALALPRFVSIEANARTAALAGIEGAFGSAISLVHAKWLADGTGAAGTVNLEGDTVEVNASGWPTIDTANSDQDTAAELYGILMQQALPTGWTSSETAAAGAGTATYTLSGTGGGSFSYDASTGVVN